MLAQTETGTLVGVEARRVLVEAEFTRGLPGLDLIGLADAEVKESRSRIKAAFEALDLRLPERHLLVHLAPSELRKSGAQLDLPIAVAALAAAGLCAPNELGVTLLVGELALSGDLRPVRGVLAHLSSARARGLRAAIVPAGNEAEAALARGLDVYVAASLRGVVAHLAAERRLTHARPSAPPSSSVMAEDLADVSGQELGRRALEIAAAGRHGLLFVGPPGAGKTMLARRLAGILPPPTDDERADLATIAGVAGVAWRDERPFRAPHHTVSAGALVGGGDPVRPGELTLAHGGVLFLDELAEFRRDALESLRATMESGVAVVARVRSRVSMPARPEVTVAAMNPCPCGYAGDKKRICGCGPERIARYRGRISGPILDRFDLHVPLGRVEPRALRRGLRGESSAVVAARVAEARARLARRTSPTPVAPSATELLEHAMERLGLSARGYRKVLAVAATIAALADTDVTGDEHVAEALQFRVLEARGSAVGPEGGERSWVESAKR